MTFSTLFFDLDATLYPASSGLWNAIKSRIQNYMIEVMGFSEQEARKLREAYYHNYGTTLEGLRRHHDIDPADYLAYVHDVPIEDFIKVTPQLIEILSTLPQTKWVFTNADRDHAQRVLEHLEVHHLFAGIVDVYALDYQVKPQLNAYQQALQLTQAPSPTACVFFDDLPQNIPPANEIGFFTVLVNENEVHNSADLHITSLLALPRHMPELWP